MKTLDRVNPIAQFPITPHAAEPSPLHRADPPAPRPRPRARAAAMDLRRRHGRDLAELLVRRSDFLERDERTLIRLVYADGVALREIARINGSRERSLSRRLARIRSRLLSREFVYIASRFSQLRGVRKSVAQACVLQGLPMRDAATHLGLSLYRVRRERSWLLDRAADADDPC